MRLFIRKSLHAAAIVLAMTSAAHAASPAAKRQTPQERKRQQILDELGLERTDTAAPPAVTPPSLPAPPEAAVAAPPDRPSLEPPARTAPSPSFRKAIHPLLLQSCQVCHRAGGPGGTTRLVLVGDAAADFASVRSLVTPSAPLTSPLLLKASGPGHGGGAPWPASGEAHERVLAWIAKGARFDGVAAAAAPVVPINVERVERRPAAPRASAPQPAAPTPAPDAPAPVATPAGDASAEFHALLTSACAPCHSARGAAAATKLVLTGEPSADVASARALVDPAAPALSLLVRKATGELHGGGVVLPPNDPRLATLTAWIESVSTKPITKPITKPDAPVAPVAPVAPTAEIAAAPPVPAAAPHAPNGLPLAGGFLLNGRFDLAYERHQFSGDPFADASTAALRSYHHFLFLSRESADDPFGLSVELTSLLFWEAHARLGGHGRPWHLLVSGGKILVPFGADPLTHQSYGGLAGFDQRLLPAIWSQEGVAAHLTVERGRLVLTDDAFVVRGYALSRADAVLNLQADFSATDDARLGWGNRVGLAWMNASAWYSAYFNPLGFGRRLFMQAADLTLWRPRGVPVLGHFSAGAGLLRADVSGGGAGLDYYHFGSYVQLRYHPTDWLYLQYRQGLRTFDNRRGVILDETRLSPDDLSTHNFAVVARCRGLSFTLAYFLIFEKAGELPNDFARASVAYDF
jgi:hypothetical protein